MSPKKIHYKRWYYNGKVYLPVEWMRNAPNTTQKTGAMKLQTGLYATNKTNVSIDICKNQNSQSGTIPFIGQGRWGEYPSWLLGTSTIDHNYLFYGYGTTNLQQKSSCRIANGERLHLQVLNGKLICNGTVFAAPAWGSYTQTRYPLQIFGSTEGISYSLNATIWNCQINEGDELIRDYVPAVNGNTVGLWDRINNTFIGGTGGSSAAWNGD